MRKKLKKSGRLLLRGFTFCLACKLGAACTSFHDCNTRSTCFHGQCMCHIASGNVGQECNKMTVASWFYVITNIALMVLYGTLLAMHLTFVFAVSGKAPGIARLIRTVYHILSIASEIFLFIFTPIEIYFTFGQGDLHQLVLKRDSIYISSDIGFLVSNVFLIAMIPGVWLLVADKLEIFQTSKYGWLPRALQVGTAVLIFSMCGLFIAGYQLQNFIMRQGALLTLELYCLVIFLVGASLLVRSFSPLRMFGWAFVTKDYLIEIEKNSSGPSRRRSLQPEFKGRWTERSRRKFQKGIQELKRNRLSSIVERSTEVEHGTTSTYEKPKDQKDTELETDLEKCALVTASGKGPGKEQSKSEEMDLPRDGGKKRESDEPIRRASLPPGSKRPDSSKPPPRLSSSEILIVVFTSRLSLLIVVLLMMQSMRVVSMVSPGLGPLSFFSEKACYVTVAAVNYLITGYLYGYYPRELWDVFRELMETFWGPCSPFARRRTSLTDVHPVET